MKSSMPDGSGAGYFTVFTVLIAVVGDAATLVDDDGDPLPAAVRDRVWLQSVYVQWCKRGASLRRCASWHHEKPRSTKLLYSRLP
jgi:hypothetical protein